MEEQRSSYLEIEVPLRRSVKWFEQLQEAMIKERIPVKWQKGNYHITAAFIDYFCDGDRSLELSDAFDNILSKQAAPYLTLDKVDAFAARSNGEIIVNITSTCPSEEFMALVDNLRKEARIMGANVESEFLLHITLGRVDPSKASIEQVRKITNSISIPSFSICLNEADYRFYRGYTIREWIMKK